MKKKTERLERREGFTWKKRGWVVVTKGKQVIPIGKLNTAIPVFCLRLDAEVRACDLGNGEVRPCQVTIEVKEDK